MAAATERTARSRLVLSPHEPLIAGGHAEEFERRVQQLSRQGHRHLVVDLRGVPEVDSAGVRALVRAHTTMQRLNGSFRIVAPNPRVREVLDLAHLGGVFEIYESLDEAESKPWPWRAIGVTAAGAALSLGLVWAGLRWPQPLAGGEMLAPALEAGEPGAATHPFLEALKLLVAALIGTLVTVVHRPAPGDRPITRAMEHAQILLCVSGAMMMIIIGGSLARAFGIVGAASIIRFRTPVEDPKDATIMFLLMGLGMASGLGAFAVAGLGTLFLCLFLLLLDRIGGERPRVMKVELVATDRDFPLAHVQAVFARNGVVFEPREISQGDEVTITYYATIDRSLSLEDLSNQLLADGNAGLESVSWEPAKKSAAVA